MSKRSLHTLGCSETVKSELVRENHMRLGGPHHLTATFSNVASAADRHTARLCVFVGKGFLGS